MLEIDCNCGWSGNAPTRDELLVLVQAHVNEVHPNEQRDEGMLRAVIAKTAHEVKE